jgi:hypothetical protein
LIPSCYSKLLESIALHIWCPIIFEFDLTLRINLLKVVFDIFTGVNGWKVSIDSLASLRRILIIFHYKFPNEFCIDIVIHYQCIVDELYDSLVVHLLDNSELKLDCYLNCDHLLLNVYQICLNIWVDLRSSSNNNLFIWISKASDFVRIVRKSYELYVVEGCLKCCYCIWEGWMRLVGRNHFIWKPTPALLISLAFYSRFI